MPFNVLRSETIHTFIYMRRVSLTLTHCLFICSYLSKCICSFRGNISPVGLFTKGCDLLNVQYVILLGRSTMFRNTFFFFLIFVVIAYVLHV